MKKRILFVFLMCCLLLSNMTTYASIDSEKQTNADRGVAVTPVGGCIQCGSLMYFMCWQDMQLIDQGYHTRFFWQPECYARYYKSRTYHACIECGNYSFQEGFHWCFESHESCGLGEYNICPSDITRKEFLGF